VFVAIVCIMHVMLLYRDPSSLNATGLNIPCMAEYGGPVDPSVALGGYGE